MLKLYNYRGKTGNLLKASLLFYPGDIGAHVTKVMAAMVLANAKTLELTVGEWVVFLSLLVGATLQGQSGRALWDPVRDRPFCRGHPGFRDYMRTSGSASAIGVRMALGTTGKL